MKYYEIKADMHTHTLASDHAFSTALEMITYAKKAGLDMIAITDHAVEAKDAPRMSHFSSMELNMPRYVEGIYVIPGVEANIIDHEGNLDIDEKLQKTMSWIVASYHAISVKPGTKEDHTRSYLKLAHNPYVDVIGHPSTPEFEFELEPVLSEFKKCGKLVELNDHSFDLKPESLEFGKAIVRVCKELSVPVIVDTDAHICFQVGGFSNARRILSELDFPEELIVNRTVDGLIDRINRKKGIDLRAYRAARV